MSRLLVLFASNFIVLCLEFGPLIHFKLIFVKTMRLCPIPFFHLHVSDLSCCHVYAIVLRLFPCRRPADYIYVDVFLVSALCSTDAGTLSWLLFVIALKAAWCLFASLCSSPSILCWLFRFLLLHINFCMYVYSRKIVCWNFDSDYIETTDQSYSCHLTILNLPVNKYVIQCHLLIFNSLEYYSFLIDHIFIHTYILM